MYDHLGPLPHEKNQGPMVRLGAIFQKNEEKIFWIGRDLNPGPKK